MKWITFAAAVTFAVAAARPCLADEVLLVDGTVFTGTVDKVEKDGVTLTMRPSSGGTAVVKVPASRLDPTYFYGLLDIAAGKDAKAHVELAVWAVEQGLFSRARVQMKRAEELDPAYVRDLREDKFPEMREGIATQIFASAEGDVKAGRLDVAEQKLELLLLRLPDTEAGGKARDAMTSLEQAMEARDAKVAEEEKQKLAEGERKAAEERAKKFAEFDADLAKVKKLALAGLKEDSDSKSLDLLSQALTKAKTRLANLDEMDKPAGTDEAYTKDVTARRERIHRGMVKVYLHRADIYIFRGNSKDAMREIDAAKEIDPKNPDVATAAILAAIADSDQDISETRWRRARSGAGAGGRFSGGGRGGGGGRR